MSTNDITVGSKPNMKAKPHCWGVCNSCSCVTGWNSDVTTTVRAAKMSTYRVSLMLDMRSVDLLTMMIYSA